MCLGLTVTVLPCPSLEGVHMQLQFRTLGILVNNYHSPSHLNRGGTWQEKVGQQPRLASLCLHLSLQSWA